METSVPAWTLIPFGMMLMCIAIAPLFLEKSWEKNLNKLIVSLVLGLPTAAYMIYIGLGEKVAHQLMFDYVPFIILLCSLFAVTGGIHLSGDIAAKPKINTLFLGIGYVLASLMGTTGAAMLLIRPIIATNAQRKHKIHTILFFIATVANCGGLLTPLGDPPLFLLYLRGAEFTWFLNLLPEWAFVGALLLGIYFLVDTYYYKKENLADIKKDNTQQSPIRISGNVNFLYLVGIVLSVAFINPGTIPGMADHDGYTANLVMKYLREIVLVLIILGSIFTTKKDIRIANNYSWSPIIEVAALFLGIFITMTPALLFLQEHAASLGLDKSWQFYYATGALSSFLDNAPTALAFHSVASGLPESIAAANANIVDGLLNFNGNDVSFIARVPETLLKAISIGAVFFGAMTYIGNGPNFMVKAIAEENKISMPSFFGYMIKFSLIILLPIYIITQLIFF